MFCILKQLHPGSGEGLGTRLLASVQKLQTVNRRVKEGLSTRMHNYVPATFLALLHKHVTMELRQLTPVNKQIQSITQTGWEHSATLKSSSVKITLHTVNIDTMGPSIIPNILQYYPQTIASFPGSPQQCNGRYCRESLGTRLRTTRICNLEL